MFVLDIAFRDKFLVCIDDCVCNYFVYLMGVLVISDVVLELCFYVVCKLCPVCFLVIGECFVVVGRIEISFHVDCGEDREMIG